MTQSYAVPVDVPRALRALRALAQDPDETSHVFTIIEALSYKAPDHLVGLFHRDGTGERLLKERPSLVSLLADRAALRRMPEGSLARAYLAFVESEGITADGLVAASETGRLLEREAGSELEFVSERMRDTHDLWHTVTGYQGDLLGETALLAFNVPQTKNPGIAAIVMLGFYKVRQLSAVGVILDGFRRGVRAKYLAAIDWESLLPLPLDDVRRQLNLEAPPVYQAVRSDELRAQGRLEPRPQHLTHAMA
jgi:ubiquinone biosynthesis protein COQ4